MQKKHDQQSLCDTNSFNMSFHIIYYVLRVRAGVAAGFHSNKAVALLILFDNGWEAAGVLVGVKWIATFKQCSRIRQINKSLNKYIISR